MLPLMSGLILCNHLKMPTHIHHFFNMMFNHDESQVDYLGYKELFIMNDGQTHANTNNDDGKSTISSCDVCSLYPYIMSQKLPISNYKFVSTFNKNRYGQKKTIHVY